MPPNTDVSRFLSKCVMVVEVQRVDAERPSTTGQKGLVVRNVTPEISTAHVPVSESLRLDALEVAVANEVVRRAPAQWRPWCVTRKKRPLNFVAKIVQLLDLAPVAEGCAQETPRHPRGLIVGTPVVRGHGMVRAGLQDVDISRNPGPIRTKASSTENLHHQAHEGRSTLTC